MNVCLWIIELDRAITQPKRSKRYLVQGSLKEYLICHVEYSL